MNIKFDTGNHGALDQIEAATQLVAGHVEGKYKDQRLLSHFQPIYSLVHKRPVGYEALLRAHNQNNIRVPPLEIFKIAANEYETVFLDRLCRNLHLRNFLSLSDDRSWIFLNISPQVTIGGKKFGAYFEELLERYHISPSRIVIEILESKIQDESLLSEAVNYYKDLGCLIAIDDFGAGHSNFDRIWRLAPQIVKLDRSMIVQAANKNSVRRVLPNLTNLLHESGSLVLMEGIETEDEALISLDAGIDFVQGYYFGKPNKFLVSPEENADLLPDLCAKFKSFTQKETEKKHLELRPYLDIFQQAAQKLKNNIPAEFSCTELLGLPKVERCYLINEDGKQQGSNMVSRMRSTIGDPRFTPLADAKDAIWSRRHYFRRAINNPGEIQISRPYLSIIGASMCITLSVTIDSNLHNTQVLCCDLDWHENS
jgi:EAL domain-containing protein (putative c-di-GMP-specific phosphodiesterase class I)